MRPLNVLLVTYSFPPAGGVGVLRAASLARYLPDQGIRLDVLTARNPSAVGTDSTLLQTIPPAVTVHRTTTLDLPFGLKKWLKKLISGQTPAASPSASPVAAKPGLLKRSIQDLLLPDPQVTWLPILARAAGRIVRARAIDLVLITVPPFSSVLLVPRLRKQFPHLPIVVDFRDEWLSTTLNLVSFSRSDRALQVARNAEAAAVANSTAIVAVTEAARREIRNRYPGQPGSKFHLVPNGFDRSPAPAPEPEPHDPIAVTYIGSIYGSTEPTTLVEALLSLPPAIRSRFRLRFIGRIEEPRYRDALLQLGDMVELNGFLPQQQALDAIRHADYALLITHDPLNVSAKFYDYLGAGKPILAAIHPQGEVRRLIDQLHAGWWADSRDAAAIRQLFLDAAARGPSLAAAFQPDRQQIARYERQALAQQYAALLTSIARPQPQNQPSHAAAAEVR